MTRILFADDDAIIRRVIETRLRKEGYDVTVVEGGRQALERLGLADESGGVLKREFELILSDQMMPEVGGMDVLRRIRSVATSSELPVIMVTAMGRSEDIVKAMEAGANDYVTKPIDFGVLIARMKAHIELKRAHKALKESHRSLIKSAKMESVGHLAAGVAHEIRNPLAQIQMGLDGIRQMFAENNPNLGEMLDMMATAVTNADDIVTGLVSFSSASRLKLESTDLNSFVNDCLSVLNEEIAVSGKRVKCVLAESAPTALLASDELRQVFLRVMLNALQASPEGGTVTVRTVERVVEGLEHDDGARVGAFVRNGEVATLIEIVDCGPGISPEDLERVFDPFFTGKATGEGKGLGLTVSRTLMELHGGVIQLRNREPENGLIATLFLRSRETGML